MHVAYFAPSWPPAYAANGIVTYVAAMRQYLISCGHEVSVVTADGIFSGEPIVTQARKPSRIARSLRGWWDRLTDDTRSSAARIGAQFQALHRAKPIDIIEMEESFGWSAAVASMIRIPLVMRLHGPFFLYPQAVNSERSERATQNRNKGEARAFASARAMTAPSRTTLAQVCSRFDCATKATAIIPNPVRANTSDELWRSSAADTNLLLWVGRFTKLKGPDRILAAFAKAVESRPALRLEMVGPDHGFLLDSGEFLGAEDYCTRFLAPEVRQRVFFRGLLTPSEIAALRLKAGLTVITSRRENFPYAVVEAMGAGCPFVATRWDGIDELVTDGVTGWVVNPDDPAALAAVLLSALEDVEGREQRGRAGWQHCQNTLSLNKVGEQTLHFYRSVLAGSSV